MCACPVGHVCGALCTEACQVNTLCVLSLDGQMDLPVPLKKGNLLQSTAFEFCLFLSMCAFRC